MKTVITKKTTTTKLLIIVILLISLLLLSISVYSATTVVGTLPGTLRYVEGSAFSGGGSTLFKDGEMFLMGPSGNANLILWGGTEANGVGIGIEGASTVPMLIAPFGHSVHVGGKLTGKIGVISKSSDYTLGTDSSFESYGYIVLVTSAATVTLPTAVQGMNACIYSTGANTIRINPDDSDRIILNGVALSNGVDIYSSGSAGDYICVISDSSDGWITMGASGTWSAGS